MKDLNKKSLSRFLRLIIGLALLLFLPVWTLYYWQAWVLLAVFSLSVLVLNSYLMKKDPELLERRINSRPGSESQKNQKILHYLLSNALLVAVLLPVIDHRFAWSTVPPYVVAAGNLLVVLGFVIVILVFRENSFASAVVEISPGQKIVSTGPYALVRHPMYLGLLIALLGVPLALGSWWGLLTLIPITAVIVGRLLTEETFLVGNLPGYSEYRHRVRYRLLPFIW